jgi:hypothetical protein
MTQIGGAAIRLVRTSNLGRIAVTVVVAIALSAGSPVAAHRRANEQQVVAELRSKDQALLDAIAPGNRAIWEQTLTRNAVYIDENGSILERAAFLAAMQPLGPGLSGQIRIIEYQARPVGDQMFVIHRDEEREKYHGIDLLAHYLTTETWVREGAQWKLAAVHTFVEPVDPPAIALTPDQLDDYVGAYELVPGIRYVIKRDGNHLTGGREGGTQTPLLAELRDVLFVPGQPRSRKLFRRGPAGAVTGFVDRREGEDLVFRRLP